MPNSRYLYSTLTSQVVGLLAPQTALNHFHPLIQQWAGTYLLQTKLSGSHAKQTSVKCSSDVDIFISLSPNLTLTLSDIYSRLYEHFDRLGGYRPRKQSVSVRVNYGNGTVDLVPGRKQNHFYNDHSLYVNKKGTWTQTDVDMHIQTVLRAGQSDIIRLVKIWRERQQLDFPSLYLELAVIEAVQGQFFTSFENQFRRTLGWMYNNIETVRFIDPSNTNNILSDDLTANEKRMIAQKARLGVVGTIDQVVW